MMQDESAFDAQPHTEEYAAMAAYGARGE